MKLTIVPLLAGIIAISGCSTIEVTNGQASNRSSQEVYEYWHHNFAYSLYEGSSPVNLSACQEDWGTIKMERGLVQAIGGGVDTAIVFVDVWDPWSAKLYCSEL